MLVVLVCWCLRVVASLRLGLLCCCLLSAVCYLLSAVCPGDALITVGRREFCLFLV